MKFFKAFQKHNRFNINYCHETSLKPVFTNDVFIFSLEMDLSDLD